MTHRNALAEHWMGGGGTKEIGDEWWTDECQETNDAWTHAKGWMEGIMIHTIKDVEVLKWLKMGIFGFFGGVTCVWGRGRPKVEGLVAGRPTLLLSSSSALVSCSNCTSCSLTDSSRAAALSHCSIHTTQPQGERRGRYTHAYSPKTGYSSGRECITKTHSPNRVQRDPADAWFEWGGGYPQILLGN